MRADRQREGADGTRSGMPRWLLWNGLRWSGKPGEHPGIKQGGGEDPAVHMRGRRRRPTNREGYRTLSLMPVSAGLISKFGCGKSCRLGGQLLPTGGRGNGE